MSGTTQRMPASGRTRDGSFAGHLLRLCAAILSMVLFADGLAFGDDLGAGSPLRKEYRIKAAFLYNFTKFVEWPATSFAHPSDPIVIGVLGHAGLAAEVEQIARGRRVSGRAIVVRRVDAPEQARSIHLLFLSATEDALVAEEIAAIREAAVLTVGESASFAGAGGIITFVLIGDKVRFEINVAAAERAGLHLSAQLQKLATVVRREL